VIAVTLLVVGGAAHFLLGFDLKGAVLAGAVFGGVCSFFVFHILDSVNLEAGVEDSLMLESTMTETISIMLALAVFQSTAGVSAFQGLAFGLVFGLLAGIVWVRMLRFVSDFPHKDALTLSLVLALAAFCEMVFPNSGMTSAFFFGLAMGNAGLLKSRTRFEGLLRFQEDVLMAGGTFLFFYVGLSALGMDTNVVLFAALFWIAALLVRVVAIRISMPDEGLNIWLAGLSPKGLSAVLIVNSAVVVGISSAQGLFALMIPMIVLSGAFAGMSSGALRGRIPPRIETVASSRKWGAERSDEGKISHAYDMDEVKRTIDGKEGEE
ncbi:MAG: hypothetical protein ABIF01_04250, partial [Candidatus Micrarchaeota archaeon]